MTSETIIGIVTLLLSLAGGLVAVGRLVASTNQLKETLNRIDAKLDDHDAIIRDHSSRIDRIEARCELLAPQHISAGGR
jgi:hypothetical protein